jgi:hypothetical protein
METPKDAPDGFNPFANVLFGRYAKEGVAAFDGNTAIPADGLIERVCVDGNGLGEIRTDLPFGNYYLKELETADGYGLDETRYDIVFDYDTDGEEIVQIAANNGKPIENILQRGSLKVIKTFEGKDTPIAGVEFNIIGETTVGAVVNIKETTDENGEILLEGLPVGDYTVTEIASELTEGYVLSPAENAIVAANEIAEMTIENKLIRGNVRIVKTDGDTGATLEGAAFGLYEKDGAQIAEAITDGEGVAEFPAILYGDYKIKETFAPKGYAACEAVWSVEIREAGQTVTLEISNSKILPKAPAPSNAPSSAPPKTGDESGMAVYIAIMFASAAALIGFGVYGKRRKPKKGELTHGA